VLTLLCLCSREIRSNLANVSTRQHSQIAHSLWKTDSTASYICSKRQSCPCPCHEGIREKKGIAPLILNLGTKRRLVVSFTLRPLYPRTKNPWAHWIGGWVGTRTCVVVLGKRKSLVSTRIRNPDGPARRLVGISTAPFGHCNLVSYWKTAKQLNKGLCCDYTEEFGTTRLYRVSQEEWTKIGESVPYVKLYRYNPKHLYPKLNGYGDNGQRKVWTSCISAYCTSSAVSHWPWQCNKSSHLCDCTRSAQRDKTVLHYCQIFTRNVKCLVTLRTTTTWVRVFCSSI